MSIVTEIVTMKIVEGTAAKDFINIVDHLEKEYHSKQPGFIDTELLFNDKSGEWMMIQHWDTMEHLTSASKQMFKDPVASTFVQVINPQAVKMTMLPQLKRW